jgi:disulfide oxidoreductase YuzD
MFDENMQPVIDKSDNVMSVRYHQIYHGQKQDCGYERYGIVLDRIFPEADGNFDFEYRFVPLTKQNKKNKTTNMVVINGVSIDGNSRSVVISNGKVIVNGKRRNARRY